MLGCGSALLILLVAGSLVGYFVAKHPRQLRGALGTLFASLEDSLEKSFSTDVTAAERQEFRDARARFHAAWDSGQIDMAAADALRRRLLLESRKPNLGPEDVRDLARFLDRLATAPARRAA
jgi:hypothetical protein